MSDPKTNALEAVLLFYRAAAWDDDARKEWKRLTGTTEATTRNLADVCRAALGKCPACGTPLSVRQISDNYLVAWCGHGPCPSGVSHNETEPVFGLTEGEAKQKLCRKIIEERTT